MLLSFDFHDFLCISVLFFLIPSFLVILQLQIVLSKLSELTWTRLLPFCNKAKKIYKLINCQLKLTNPAIIPKYDEYLYCIAYW